MYKVADQIEKNMNKSITPNQIPEGYEILCPKCQENCYIKINNYKITLYGCKNGHFMDDILFEEFEKTQIFDKSKIICEKCKSNNMGKSNKNKFFRCNDCKMNLCPSCISSHSKLHNLIDYKQKNFFCEEHKTSFLYYCANCRLNFCSSCVVKHINHKINNNSKRYRIINNQNSTNNTY